MNFNDKLKNNFLFNSKYKTDSDSVIIACYFNPQRNPYRLKAFREFYNSIKHLNHSITECVIGDSKPELVDEFPSLKISRIFTENLLWHKEAILNKIISDLPKEYKYIFWVDADVLFTNKNWLVEATKKLRNGANLIQPFEYCVHLNKDQLEPEFDINYEYQFASDPIKRHPNLWKSFGSNYILGNSNDSNYNKHGHVGFAWGAKREVLEKVPLYDRALVGGADHIIAHAGAGQINHPCINKSFTDDIDSVNDWSLEFYKAVRGKIDYVKGDLYHIWHGDVDKRDYLKRIQDFTAKSKTITKKDKNGLYVSDNEEDNYVKEYFNKREVKSAINLAKNSTYGSRGITSEDKFNSLKKRYPDKDDSFIESMMIAYMTDSTTMGTIMGGNPIGAMIGDALNNNDEANNIEFGGGEFGGGGAGGDWNENQTNDNNTDQQVEPFS